MANHRFGCIHQCDTIRATSLCIISNYIELFGIVRFTGDNWHASNLIAYRSVINWLEAKTNEIAGPLSILPALLDAAGFRNKLARLHTYTRYQPERALALTSNPPGCVDFTLYNIATRMTDVRQPAVRTVSPLVHCNTIIHMIYRIHHKHGNSVLIGLVDTDARPVSLSAAPLVARQHRYAFVVILDYRLIIVVYNVCTVHARVRTQDSTVRNRGGQNTEQLVQRLRLNALQRAKPRNSVWKSKSAKREGGTRTIRWTITLPSRMKTRERGDCTSLFTLERDITVTIFGARKTRLGPEFSTPSSPRSVRRLLHCPRDWTSLMSTCLCSMYRRSLGACVTQSPWDAPRSVPSSGWHCRWAVSMKHDRAEKQREAAESFSDLCYTVTLYHTAETVTWLYIGTFLVLCIRVCRQWSGATGWIEF